MLPDIARLESYSAAEDERPFRAYENAFYASTDDRAKEWAEVTVRNGPYAQRQGVTDGHSLQLSNELWNEEFKRFIQTGE
jgi:hypothetical protein